MRETVYLWSNRNALVVCGLVIPTAWAFCFRYYTNFLSETNKVHRCARGQFEIRVHAAETGDGAVVSAR